LRGTGSTASGTTPFGQRQAFDLKDVKPARAGSPSGDPARILVVATPDAIRMVEELFQLERAGQVGVRAGLEHAAVDPAAVAALYARYDSELVAG